MDELLLAETHEAIDAALAADPTLSTDDAIQYVVHAGIVHDVITCTSRLCAMVTEQRTGGH